MTRAKLSGSLLVPKEPRKPAQDLNSVINDADESGPVLVWSVRLKDEAEPNTTEDTGDPTHRAVAAPQASDLDPPVFRATAGTASDNAVNRQSSRPYGHATALRRRSAHTAEDSEPAPVVAAVTRKAALACLERLGGGTSAQAGTAPFHSPNAPGDSLLLLGQLVEFAAQRGLNV